MKLNPTLETLLAAVPAELSDLYSHPEFIPFGSTSDDWINDPDRMERCHDAAEDGAEGSTHAEILSDWREFLARLFSDLESEIDRAAENDDEAEIAQSRLEAIRESIDAEISACESWHESHGSIHTQVG